MGAVIRSAFLDYQPQASTVTVDASMWAMLLGHVDELRELVADLYDPNDCHTTDDGVCHEHNEWDPADEFGRSCPHLRARRLVAGWRR